MSQSSQTFGNVPQRWTFGTGNVTEDVAESSKRSNNPQMVNGTFRHMILPQADIQRIEAWHSPYITREEFTRRQTSRQQLHNQVITRLISLLNHSLHRPNMMEHDIFCSRVSSMLQRIHVGQWDSHFSQLNAQCASSMINGEPLPETEARSRWIFNQVDEIFQPAPIDSATAAANFEACSTFVEKKVPVAFSKAPLFKQPKLVAATIAPVMLTSKRGSSSVEQESGWMASPAKIQRTGTSELPIQGRRALSDLIPVSGPVPTRLPTPTKTPSPLENHSQITRGEKNGEDKGKAPVEDNKETEEVFTSIGNLMEESDDFWSKPENEALLSNGEAEAVSAPHPDQNSTDFEEMLRMMLKDVAEQDGGAGNSGNFGIMR